MELSSSVGDKLPQILGHSFARVTFQTSLNRAFCDAPTDSGIGSLAFEVTLPVPSASQLGFNPNPQFIFQTSPYRIGTSSRSYRASISSSIPARLPSWGRVNSRRSRKSRNRSQSFRSMSGSGRFRGTPKIRRFWRLHSIELTERLKDVLLLHRRDTDSNKKRARQARLRHCRSSANLGRRANPSLAGDPGHSDESCTVGALPSDFTGRYPLQAEQDQAR